MKPSELFDVIAELVDSTTVSDLADQDTTAKEVAAAREKNTADLARVRELKDAVERYHPSRLVDRLCELERSLMYQVHSIVRVEDRLVAEAGPVPGDAELSARIKDTLYREQHFTRSTVFEASGITNCRWVPTRFIRPDATAHFRAEVDEAQAELQVIERKHKGPNTAPFGRTATRIEELRDIIGEWPRTEKLCKLGEQIHAIREEQRQLDEQRERLRAEWRQRALAV